jgi:glycosyltransferase involved in cell wall biosynthesis
MADGRRASGASQGQQDAQAKGPDAMTAAGPRPEAPARPLRIGLVTPAWPGTGTANGIASATGQLVAGLEAVGHEVTVLTLHLDAPDQHPRVIGLPATGMSLLQRLQFRLSPDRVIRQLMLKRLITGARRAVAEQAIEVLMMEESFGWAGAVRRTLSIPVVVTLHGPHWLHRVRPGQPKPGPDARREAWEAAGLHQIDGIISPSRDVLDRTRLEWGLPAIPTTIIGNPVGIGPTGAPAAQGTDPRILFIGRFDRIKGADLMLQAFARIGAAHPTCQLTFVGPDSGLAQSDGTTLHLPQALSALPETIRTRIDHLGHRTRHQIAEIRRHHPITVVASRYETFGVALIEAMAAGSAVVSTRVGGCAEIIRDGQTGLLVAPENPEALADACLRLLADPDLALRMGLAARDDVAARFAPDVVAREVAAFLAPLCQVPA